MFVIPVHLPACQSSLGPEKERRNVLLLVNGHDRFSPILDFTPNEYMGMAPSSLQIEERGRKVELRFLVCLHASVLTDLKRREGMFYGQSMVIVFTSNE